MGQRLFFFAGTVCFLTPFFPYCGPSVFIDNPAPTDVSSVSVFLLPAHTYFNKNFPDKILATITSILLRPLDNQAFERSLEHGKLTSSFPSLSHWNISWLWRVGKIPLLNLFQRWHLTMKPGISTGLCICSHLFSLGPFKAQLLEFRFFHLRVLFLARFYCINGSHSASFWASGDSHVSCTGFKLPM